MNTLYIHNYISIYLFATHPGVGLPPGVVGQQGLEADAAARTRHYCLLTNHHRRSSLWIQHGMTIWYCLDFLDR